MFVFFVSKTVGALFEGTVRTPLEPALPFTHLSYNIKYFTNFTIINPLLCSQIQIRKKESKFIKFLPEDRYFNLLLKFGEGV